MINKIKQFLHIKPKEITVFEKIDNLFYTMKTETLLVELGDDFVKFGDTVVNITQEVREALWEETGYIMPAVRICGNSNLQENEMVIKISGKIAFRDFLIPTEQYIREDFYYSLKQLVEENWDRVFTHELTEKYMDTVSYCNSRLICDINGSISVSEIRAILVGILKHGKSIHNIVNIFEKISEQIFVENVSNRRNPKKISEEIVKCI